MSDILEEIAEMVKDQLNDYFTDEDCTNLDTLRSRFLLDKMDDENYWEGEKVFMTLALNMSVIVTKLMLATSAAQMLPKLLGDTGKKAQIPELLKDALLHATLIAYVCGVDEIDDECQNELNAFVDDESEAVMESPYLCAVTLLEEIGALSMEHLYYSQLPEEERSGMDVGLASLGLMSSVARLAASMDLSVEEVLGIY